MSDDRQRIQEDFRILREQVFNLANTVHKLVESFEHLNERVLSIDRRIDRLVEIDGED